MINKSKAFSRISAEWWIILFFALVKLLIYFFTYSNYELHRDAYLYYAQSEHLAWGYVAVPPSIAVVGKVATYVFGNTTFALRFFPAVIGAMMLIVGGLMVKELGGKKIAITLSSLAFILSPAFLHTNALFQPVCFNHFYWLLSGYLFLLLIKRDDPKIWIWIAIVFGLAFLNKYSVVFLYTAFGISLLLTRYRALCFSKYFVTAVIIGFIIILPNLIWQYQNNWPVLMHMAALRETQLVHVLLSDFIIAQFLMNIQAVLIWILAVLVVLFYPGERQFRLFGFIYIFVIALLIMGSGKSYYPLGVYPILFVFGAYFIEKYAGKYLIPISVFLIISMFVSWYISLSFGGIPFYGFEKVARKEGYRWEDGVNHDVPQDMSDMIGWNEIGETVRDVWLKLPPGQRNQCCIFCYHYGQAGAVMFHGKKAGVPQPISHNGSFIFWAPDSIPGNMMIWVHSDLGNDTQPDILLPKIFERVELKSTVENDYFRENGTKIYLCINPTEAYKQGFKEEMKELKDRYRRK